MVRGAFDTDLSVVVDVHRISTSCAPTPLPNESGFSRCGPRSPSVTPELPSTVRFELLNEPHLRLTGQRWNDLLAEALAVVCDSNPHRDLIVGPAAMNTIAGLADLELPDDDGLIVTIHYYLPLPFTHQGRPWSARHRLVGHELGYANRTPHRQ